MAEVLIIAGRGPGDPQRPGLWKDDDPVVVMPDGHQWGIEELNPSKFRILKRPNVPVQALRHLMEPGPGLREAQKRRKFRVDPSGRVFNQETGEEDFRGGGP